MVLVTAFKRCSVCGDTKPADAFYLQRSGKGAGTLYPICQECKTTDAAARRAANPELHKGRVRAWRLENREAGNESARRWQRSNKQKCARAHAAWVKANPGKSRVINGRSDKKRRATNPLYRLHKNVARRIHHGLTLGRKTERTLALVGCPLEQLRFWLELDFRAGWSWENFGTDWQIDHIRPCADYDLTDPAQQRECFHHTNLQALPAKENNWKKDKILLEHWLC